MVNPTHSSHSGINHLPVLKSAAKQAPQAPAVAPDGDKPAKAHTSASVQVTLSVHSSTRSASEQPSGKVADSAAVAPVKAADNPYANTILNHISGRLQADVANGASTEDLQARLEAGLQGFLQGYHEAADMLKHLGTLDDSLQGAIADTYHQVLNGISQLAEELGLEQPEGLAKAREQVPVPEPGGAETVAKQSPVPGGNTSELAQLGSKVGSADDQKLGILQSYQKAVKESETYVDLARAKKTASVDESRFSAASSRSFSFELMTAAGDRVSIHAKAVQVSGVQGGESVSKQSSSFNFAVEGDLNKDEMRAINDLLGKVNQIAETFFSGEVGRAFEMAQNLGYDSEQISEFALNLNMASVQRVSNTYSLPAEQNPAPAKVSWTTLADFAQQVRDLGDQAEGMGQKRAIVAELAETVAREVHDKRDDAGTLNDFVKRFL